MARRNKLGQQCTAKSKTTGNQCGQPAKPGGTVCRYHGGAAPQVEAANHRRILAALIGPALTRLTKLIEDDSVPASVAYQAVRDVLDRGGFKPTEKHEVMFTDDMIAAEIARLRGELDQ
jgi:hypothetical protein